MNITVFSLSSFVSVSTSPFFTNFRIHNGPLNSVFSRSYFSHSFSTILFTSTERHNTLIKNTLFANCLDSGLIFANDDGSCHFQDYSKNEPIVNKTILPNQYSGDNPRPYFTDKTNGCGNITITGCIFDGCHADSYHGGSLHIEQDSYIIIHNTIFKNSYTKRRYGGGAVIARTITDEESDFNGERLPHLDVQYCCFDNCYGQGTNQSLYGVALFIAAEKTVLYYTSTVDCPGFNNDRFQAAGAQIDIQAINVTSHHVNTTGGNSAYCGGIEYRHANKGFFRFQTISDMHCMFAISYTDIGEASLDLSHSNVFNNQLWNDGISNDLVFPGLIHVRNTQRYDDYTFQISYFCFANNNLGQHQNARIVSRGTFNEYEGSPKKILPIKVILDNCIFDCDDDLVALKTYLNSDNLEIKNCNINGQTANVIHQLKLDRCFGEIPPGEYTNIVDDIIPTTNYFSKSEFFTRTGYFSYSYDFTKSKDFTKSSFFTNSCKFTSSDDFTKSSFFTNSYKFTSSDDFTKSSFFTNSYKFTCSDDFTKSDYLTKPYQFSKTEVFTHSDQFTQSSVFTLSAYFSKPQDFFDQSSLPEIIIPRDDSTSKNKTGMIAGISVAAVAVIVIAAIVAFFMIKKKHAHISDEDVETIDSNTSSIKNVNPIHDNNGVDDPFKEDFDD